MLIVWQNQYFENGCITTGNLQVQRNPHQNSNVILHRDWKKSILNFIRKYKRLWIVKAILNKENNSGGITIPNFRLYYRAIAIKSARFWHKKRCEEQWTRIEEEPYMNPHCYVHLIFEKGTKNMWWKKRQPLQQMLLGKQYLHVQNWN
jgi:hypothetical protein